MAVRVVAGAPPPRRRLPIAAALATLGIFVVGGIVGRVTAPRAHRAGPPPRLGPGPTRVVTGIPLGFAHSQAGAVAALSADSAVLSEPNTLLDRSRRAHVLRLIATPRYAATFGGAAGAAIDASARALPPVYFSAPIAYRVLAYDGQTATIEGWGVSVAGGASGPPRATWGTSVTTARWTGGDWKVDASRTTAGPTPALAPGVKPSNGTAFVDALSSSHGLHHVP